MQVPIYINAHSNTPIEDFSVEALLRSCDERDDDLYDLQDVKEHRHETNLSQQSLEIDLRG